MTFHSPVARLAMTESPSAYVVFWRLSSRNSCDTISSRRCLSSMGDTWDVTRVIPTCAVSGEAAGIAAAFLAANDECRSFYDLDIPTLQKYIKRHNGIIDKELV